MIASPATKYSSFVNRFGIVHLGWNDGWEQKLAAAGLQGVPGRLIKVERGECDVFTEAGVVRAVSDSVRSQDETAPVTGDWVTVEPRPDDEIAMIEAILPRQNALVRRDPGEKEIEQPLSANVDVVFLVQGFDRELRPGKLERFLALAWNADAQPVVLLTKRDVAESDEVNDRVATVAAVAPRVEVITVAAELGEGVDQIERLLADSRTGTLLGESGAGKSTLVNAMLGGEVQETQPVRGRDSKGRHTTITRDLLVLPSGGLLIDTPGIRAVGLWDAHDALRQVFEDIDTLAAGCRFNDCAHGGEPGCAVGEAVAAGDIDPRRLERFIAMSAELHEIDERIEQRSWSKNRRGKRRR